MYGLLLIMNLFAIAVFAQVKITGKATGADGKGIPGITVTVRNSTFGTATDPEGNYSLDADLKPGTYVLVFSSIGFKTKESSLTVGANTSYAVNAAMAEDVLGLDEVVITGTSQGTTKKSLGNYVATVKGDLLNKAAPSNVLAALQGKTPGAQIIQNSGDPGGSMSVRLRGISTVNSSSEPLYIIDGVIVSNSARRVTNTQAAYDG
jgi:hypothetical protein